MGWTDIHSFDRNTYCLALALYKIKFEDIWYHEITSEIMSAKKIYVISIRCLGFQLQRLISF